MGGEISFSNMTGIPAHATPLGGKKGRLTSRMCPLPEDIVCTQTHTVCGVVGGLCKSHGCSGQAGLEATKQAEMTAAGRACQLQSVGSASWKHILINHKTHNQKCYASAYTGPMYILRRDSNRFRHLALPSQNTQPRQHCQPFSDPFIILLP